MTDYEQALEHFQNSNYAKSLRFIDSEEDMLLYAEIERLSELVGDHTDGMIGGKLGQVLSNYEDRIMDELAMKAAEEVEAE